MKEIYILAENHPWYFVGEDSIRGKITREILRREEEIIKERNPDVVFVEYPPISKWRKEEELKYRCPVLVEMLKFCYPNLSFEDLNEIGKELIEKSYEKRVKFYSRIEEKYKLVFLEDYEIYREAGELYLKIKENENESHIREEFLNNAERREWGYFSKILNEMKVMERGLVVCGISHVYRNGKLKKWIKELGKYFNTEVIKVDLENVLDVLGKERKRIVIKEDFS